MILENLHSFRYPTFEDPRISSEQNQTQEQIKALVETYLGLTTSIDLAVLATTLKPYLQQKDYTLSFLQQILGSMDLEERSWRAAELVLIADPDLDKFFGIMFNNLDDINNIEFKIKSSLILSHICSHPELKSGIKIQLLEGMFEFINHCSPEQKLAIYFHFLGLFALLAENGMPIGNLEEFDWQLAKMFLKNTKHYPHAFTLLGEADDKVVADLLKEFPGIIAFSNTKPLSTQALKAELKILRNFEDTDHTRRVKLIQRSISVLTQFTKSFDPTAHDLTNQPYEQINLFQEIIFETKELVEIVKKHGGLIQLVDLKMFSDLINLQLNAELHSLPRIYHHLNLNELMKSILSDDSLAGNQSMAQHLVDLLMTYLKDQEQVSNTMKEHQIILELFANFNSDVLLMFDNEYGLIWIRLFCKIKAFPSITLIKLVLKKLYYNLKTEMRLDIEVLYPDEQLLQLIDQIGKDSRDQQNFLKN